MDPADALPCAMARLLTRVPAGTLLGGATPWSLLAAQIAVHVYRPDLPVLASLGRLGTPLAIGQLAQEDFAACSVGTEAISLEAVFRWVAGGRFRIWIHPAQVDRHGNANLSRIGPRERPHPALVGSRGLPDDSLLLPESLYYLTSHGPRTVMDRVHHVTAVGDRSRLPQGSLAPGGRPSFLVTPLGVWDFRAVGGTLRVRAVFPGVDREAFEAAGEMWPNAVPPQVPPPTPQEIEALTTLDPLDSRHVEGASGPGAAQARAALWRQEEMLIRQITARAVAKEG